MNLAEFLDGKLEEERGAQSRLAEAVGVSKSTVTGWRRGGKPSFVACLLMSFYFDEVAPDEFFAIVGEPQYQEFYRRLFPEGAPDIFSLLRDPAHREIHRKLQVILESPSKDAEIVASVVAMAYRQFETGEFLKEMQEKADDSTDDAIGTAFRAMMQSRKQPKRDKKKRGDSNKTPKSR